ncbi:MAG: hypothetical protein WBE21_10640 [Candidatus Acidiferrales bacterium]|jgi:hypothetical protein
MQTFVRYSRREAAPHSLVQHDFVDVAPAPILSWLEGSNDRVLRGVEMFCGMAIFRRIAAANVAADQAQAKMHPRVAHQETFFAAFAAGRDFLNFFSVRACLTQCDSLWRILRLFAAKNRGEPFRMKKAA